MSDLHDILNDIQSTRPNPQPRPTRFLGDQTRRPIYELRSETRWHCSHGNWTNMKVIDVITNLPKVWHENNPTGPDECILIKYKDVLDMLVRTSRLCANCQTFISIQHTIDGKLCPKCYGLSLVKGDGR